MLQKLAQSVIPKRNLSENQSADLVTSPLRTEIPKHYWLIGLATLSLLSFLSLLFVLLNGANVPFQDEFTFATLAVAVLALGYLAVDRWHRSLENSPQMSVPIHREWEFCGLSKRK